jgi:hypothetical protein
MRYRLIKGDDDVPQEYKTSFMVTTIIKTIEEELLNLWQRSEEYPFGFFDVKIYIPDTWHESKDSPPVSYKTISVTVEKKQERSLRDG